MTVVDNFTQRVSDEEFDEADREFMMLAHEHDMDARSAREILEEQEQAAQRGFAGPKSVQVGPQHQPESEEVRTSATFRRPTPIRPQPVSTTATEKPKKKGRREIRFSPALVPIYLMNELDGSVQPVYARRVPSTEIPYLDRLEGKLNDTRLVMRRLEVTDSKSQRKLDELAGQYNALMEEMLSYQVEFKPGQFATLDAAVINQLQEHLRQIQAGIDLNNGEADDEGNS